ncbi:hypothetical protein OHS33_35030 [Streptomyces sp. NBC_00536]|uniref:hypothetical protein n=1 Tax=Streptomyces sp. NBC_00536 TaxID=2975769 RepID=UPI002E80243E|nr:hypothetical protein [Streptomyces sp. NBC_00536]WUC83128.1 hypothetical protein OHS33_35030 [Streptomyces sp. NBC_00536]
MVDRTLRDMGAAHEGSVGVLLADGSEPGPVYFDVGSGGHVPSSTAWHAYDGRYGRPKAAVLRGVCACGWRGMAEYPLDWTVLDGRRPLYEADIDLSGPIGDYHAHLTVVRDKAVPLPRPLLVVLTALREELDTVAAEDPLVALKALADLRHLIVGVGQGAAREVRVGEIPMEVVATALGTSEQAARRYVMEYLHP